MAPKKKGNKKQEEDWEAELGESAPAANGQTGEEQQKQEPTAPDAAGEDDGAMSGGLLAALRKNKTKKAKKGKLVNDFVDGEDLSAAGEPDDTAVDLASKQPEEGTFDEDDVFAGKPKKGAKQAAKQPPPEPKEQEDGDGNGDGEFRVKSKKEKEREKKEREKQRKKEQVRRGSI